MPKLDPEVKGERRRALVNAAWRCAARKRLAEITVDEVCAEAGLSKGAFYGYFGSKDELIVGLLDEEAAALDRVLDEVAAAESGGIGRLRRFAMAMLAHAGEPARAQVRADLWAAVLGDRRLREHLAGAGERRRARLREWIEEGIAQGELREIPANALASTLLAMADGLTLHATVDPSAFRWPNVRRAVDELLAGVSR